MSEPESNMANSEPELDTAPAQAPPNPSSNPSKAIASNPAPGASSECALYHTVKPGEYCISVAEQYGIDFATLRELNSQIDEACSNLWMGYEYCVKGL